MGVCRGGSCALLAAYHFQLPSKPFLDRQPIFVPTRIFITPQELLHEAPTNRPSTTYQPTSSPNRPPPAGAAQQQLRSARLHQPSTYLKHQPPTTNHPQELLNSSSDLRASKDTAVAFGEGMVGQMVHIHSSMGPLGATPRQYISFVDLYARIFSGKREQVGLQAAGFLKGVACTCHPSLRACPSNARAARFARAGAAAAEPDPPPCVQTRARSPMLGAPRHRRRRHCSSRSSSRAAWASRPSLRACTHAHTRPHPTQPQTLQQQKFLKGGLGKLAEAEGTVDTLSKAADQQRQLLQVKQAEAEEALQRITKSMAQVGWDRLRVCVYGV